MNFSTAKRYFLNGIAISMRAINWIGYLSLSGMVLVTAVNVIGRYILKMPLLGEVDLVELGMVLFGGVAMLVAAIQGHHVGVDVLLVRFSRRTQIRFGRLASLLGSVTLAFLAVGVFLNGLDSWENGSTTDTLSVPKGPFEIIFAVFIFFFCLAFLIQIFRPEASGKKEEGGAADES